MSPPSGSGLPQYDRFGRHRNVAPLIAELFDLLGQLGNPRTQRIDLIGQFDDALDPGQVDALVL